MALIKAFSGAIGGTFADQWKDIVTAGPFDEFTVVAPGLLRGSNNGRGTNYSGSYGVISNGSKIFVPENTAAFIFSQSGIEEIITTPGGYEYQSGQKTVFNRDSIKSALIEQIGKRVAFGGQSASQKIVSFINLREIRGIRFGTRSPLVYNDTFYGADLEILAFGTFSLRIVDVEKFVRNFIPAGTYHYTFAAPQSRQQLASEFIQSFTVALNSLSKSYRISELPSQAHNIVAEISGGSANAGTWTERFGLQVVNIGIESIEFSPDSRELVKKFSANRMELKAYEDISVRSSSIASQQKMANGLQTHGFGDAAGMVMGMNIAQGMSAQFAPPVEPVAANNGPSQGNSAANALSFDEQVDAVKKMKELLDAGLLTEEEFSFKKKQIMGF